MQFSRQRTFQFIMQFYELFWCSFMIPKRLVALIFATHVKKKRCPVRPSLSNYLSAFAWLSFHRIFYEGEEWMIIDLFHKNIHGILFLKWSLCIYMKNSREYSLEIIWITLLYYLQQLNQKLTTFNFLKHILVFPFVFYF